MHLITDWETPSEFHFDAKKTGILETGIRSSREKVHLQKKKGKLAVGRTTQAQQRPQGHVEFRSQGIRRFEVKHVAWYDLMSSMKPGMI